MFTNVKSAFDFHQVCGLDCIPVVVPKNYRPELSYISADLFKMHLKKCCFPDC